MSVFDEASAQRQQLGAALRALRETTELSGNQFGQQTGLGQSKVSRIETGQQVPSAADLEHWLDVGRADQARRAELHELREAAATEAVSWRRHLRRGLPAIQAEVAAWEAAATSIRGFAPTIVPGLLATPTWSRAVLEAFHVNGREDLAAGVAARVARQAVLYTGKPLEFVVGEAALRWRPGPPELLRGQLDRLGVVAGLDNVTVGILPLDIETPWHTHGFNLFKGVPGGSIVHVELLAGQQNSRDPEDVARYDEAFSRLLDAAVTGEDAVALLGRIAADL